jgi:hypothetical protein
MRKACCISLHSKLVLKGFGVTPDGLETTPGALESTEIKDLSSAASKEPGDEGKCNLRNAEILHHIEAVNYLRSMHWFSRLGNFNFDSKFRPELIKSKISVHNT